jgi:hypothetical protein
MSENERELLRGELGPKKVKAAYMLVEMDLRDEKEPGLPNNHQDVAKHLGINVKTLWEWRTKDRDFIKFKNSIADDFLSENRTMVYKQLKKLISGSQPSVKAIDIFARLEGLYENKITIRNEDGGKSNESNEDIGEDIKKFQAMKKSSQQSQEGDE